MENHPIKLHKSCMLEVKTRVSNDLVSSLQYHYGQKILM